MTDHDPSPDCRDKPSRPGWSASGPDVVRVNLPDRHQIAKMLLLRLAITLLFVLVGWPAMLAALALFDGAMADLVPPSSLAVAAENTSILALLLIAIGLAWLVMSSSGA